jgi:hypothetical protein
MEIFVDIPGFNGDYRVSNYGNFLSLNNKKKIQRLLKPRKKKDGYLMVRVSNNGIQSELNAHRLVAKLFIENKNNSLQVNHKDGVKDNNIFSNLEWVTPKENIRHAIAMGLMKPHGKSYRTSEYAICHTDRKAVGKMNLCKSCYMKEYRKNRSPSR